MEYRRYLRKGLLIIICLLPMLLVWYYGDKKEGYFVDELWSYGLANSTEYPHIYSIQGWDQKWQTPEYYMNYIEVEKGQQFDYGTVIYNQTQDNHPPLFYLILHTVCSLFPGTFSKWYGIVPNIIYYAVTGLFLYLLARRLSGSKRISFITMLVWACSAGAVSCVVYIRMYMLMTMWLVILLYLYARIWTDRPLGIRVYGWTALITFLGYMTHYYFYIAVFFAGGALALMLLTDRYRRKLLCRFAAANLLSLGGILLCFPLSFWKIFGLDADRGVQAYDALQAHENLWGKLRAYIAILGQQIFGNFLKEFVLVLILIFLFCLIRRRESLGWIKEKEFSFLTVPVIMIAGYTSIIALVAPYQVDRYIFCIYPFALLVMFSFLGRLLKTLKFSAAGVCIALSVAAGAMLVQEYRTAGVNYLYLGEAQNLETAAAYGDLDCVYISRYDYLITADILEVANYKKIRRIHENEISKLYRILEPGTTEVIVYVDKDSYNRIEKMEASLISGSKLNWWEILFETSTCRVYRIFE